MTALPAIFQDSRPYVTEWYRFPTGSVISFRWSRETYHEKRKLVSKAGAVLIEDPFRKGAPVGGFTNNRRIAGDVRQES